MKYFLIFSCLISAFCYSAESEMIPQKPSFRIIVDNDFAGDPDGLAALAHQLLSLKTTVKLVTVSGLNPKFSQVSYRDSDTAIAGKKRVEHLLRLMNTSPPSVHAGKDLRFKSESNQSSAAALAIVEEANREDPLPLVITVGGPLSNLAEALKIDPSIAEKMSVIWIGGDNYQTGGGWEYNLSTDIAAAKYVFEQSKIPISQVPAPTYRQVQYSVAEMSNDFRPISAVTAWIYELYTILPDFVEMGGSLTMGDHPLVLLSALSTESSKFSVISARQINADSTYGKKIPARDIKVFTEVDTRLTLADFIATLKIQSKRNTEH